MDLQVQLIGVSLVAMTIELGNYGIWQSASATTPDMAVEIERLGFTALWLGGPPLDLTGIDELLEATDRLVVGSSIVNVWQGNPAVLAAAHRRVAGRFPERWVLGIGAGHPEQSTGYVRPMDAVRKFLGVLDDGGVPREQRALAALGPKMLELTAERAGGAVPYLVPPEHTKLARAALGPSRFLAPEHKVVLDTDPARARDTARPRIRHPYLGLVNYTSNLRRLGYSDSDLAGDGSDRLIDALVAHGDAPTIARRLAEHHAAGADHVAVQVITGNHTTHATLPDVQMQVYDDEVTEAYRTLADVLF